MITLEITEHTSVFSGTEPFRVDVGKTCTYCYAGFSAKEGDVDWEPCLLVDVSVPNISMISLNPQERNVLGNYEPEFIKGLTPEAVARLMELKDDENYYNQDCDRYVYPMDGVAITK